MRFILLLVLGSAFAEFHLDNYQINDIATKNDCPLEMLMIPEDINVTWHYNLTENKIQGPTSCNEPVIKNQKCPDGLFELIAADKVSCILISPKAHSFQHAITTCHGSDRTIFDIKRKNGSYLNRILNARNITQFWLPIQRVDMNLYNPFVWRLPGYNWGEYFKKHISHSFHRHNCLTAEWANGELIHKMTNCNDSFHSVCIFSPEPVISCAHTNYENFKALSYNPTKCYGLDYSPVNNDTISIKEVFQNRNTISILLDEIGDVDYFLASYIDANGKIWEYIVTSREKRQFSFSKYLPVDRPQLTLKTVTLKKPKKPIKMLLKTDRGKLLLTVYNRLSILQLNNNKIKYGIQCYTNANYELLDTVKIEKLIWENDDRTKSFFELELFDEGPGYYWCEAHSVFDFELIVTPKVVAVQKQRGHAFSFYLNLNKNVLFRKIKDYSKIYEDKLEKTMDILNMKDLKIHTFRMMTMSDSSENVNILPGHIRTLCHATVSLKSSAVDDSSEESSEEDDEEENDMGIRHDTTIRVEAMNLLKDLLKATSKDEFNGDVNSTEFCFAESLENKHQWMTSRLGETSTTKELCLQKNGLPVMRKCVGDFLHGATWEPLPNNKIECINIMTVPHIITKELFQIDRSKQGKLEPEKALQNVKDILSNSMEKIIPVDLFYLSHILKSVSREIILSTKLFLNSTKKPVTSTANKTPVTNITTATRDVVGIYNNLMNLNVTIISSSIKLNSTNILLETFENLIDEISMDRNHTEIARATSIVDDVTVATTDDEVKNIIYDSDGVLVKIAHNLIIFVIDPSVANITGIAIYRNGSIQNEHGQFRGEQYRFLNINQSLDELLEENGLLLATYVPESLFSRLDEIRLVEPSFNDEYIPPKIVFKVYGNDLLFQEDSKSNNKKSNGYIMSISIPGHSNYLPEILPIIFRIDNTTESQGCGYWNYSTWADDGVSRIGISSSNDDLVICGCTHLTPYAFLMGIEDQTIIEFPDIQIKVQEHFVALDVITICGCSLSLFGIVGIFITALMFQSWRQKQSTKVLLQLSAAIALQMILFCFVNTQEVTAHLFKNKIFASCILLGASLQYSVLVQFSWMLIIAYLQFRRYVVVFGSSRPTRFYLKSFIIGWGLPLVPVLLVIFIDRESFIPKSEWAICYPSGKSLYFGIILPIAIVVAANLAIFIKIVYNIVRGPESSIRHTTEKKQAMAQVRLSFLLFFLLGITWVFGILSALKAGYIFSYLFCLTATLQGFVLFVYFIILDPHTRKLWFGYIQGFYSVKDVDHTMVSEFSNKPTNY